MTQTVQDIYDKAFAQKRLEWQPTLTDVYNRISVLENEVKMIMIKQFCTGYIILSPSMYPAGYTICFLKIQILI